MQWVVMSSAAAQLGLNTTGNTTQVNVGAFDRRDLARESCGIHVSIVAQTANCATDLRGTRSAYA